MEVEPVIKQLSHLGVSLSGVDEINSLPSLKS